MRHFIGDGVLIHAGINFVLSPSPEVSGTKTLDFQRHLQEQGIDAIRGTDYPKGGLVVRYGERPGITVKVAEVGPNVGQLLIIAERQPGHIELVARHAVAVVNSYRATWPTRAIQFISVDATIRMLYETELDHAFQALWEHRLGQPEDSLKTFGRAVLGGGLRFVMPPGEDQDEKHIVEVKIESYLKDTSKLFVEAQFKWEPGPGADFDPTRRLQLVEDFIQDRVAAFLDWKEMHDDGETANE